MTDESDSPSTHPVTVCGLDELDQIDARGFAFDGSAGQHEAFVVRRGDEVFAYRNFCPHVGNPLNWKPHAFLTRKRDLIMCSVHGAIFDIATGRCVEGPCPGRSLTPLRVKVSAGQIVVYPDRGR